MNNPTRKLEWTDNKVLQVFFKIEDLNSLQETLLVVNEEDLYQLVDYKELSIAFFSKSLTGAKLRRSTIQNNPAPSITS